MQIRKYESKPISPSYESNLDIYTYTNPTRVLTQIRTPCIIFPCHSTKSHAGSNNPRMHTSNKKVVTHERVKSRLKTFSSRTFPSPFSLLFRAFSKTIPKLTSCKFRLQCCRRLCCDHVVIAYDVDTIAENYNRSRFHPTCTQLSKFQLLTKRFNSYCKSFFSSSLLASHEKRSRFSVFLLFFSSPLLYFCTPQPGLSAGCNKCQRINVILWRTFWNIRRFIFHFFSPAFFILHHSTFLTRKFSPSILILLFFRPLPHLLSYLANIYSLPRKKFLVFVQIFRPGQKDKHDPKALGL